MCQRMIVPVRIAVSVQLYYYCSVYVIVFFVIMFSCCFTHLYLLFAVCLWSACVCIFIAVSYLYVYLSFTVVIAPVDRVRLSTTWPVTRPKKLSPETHKLNNNNIQHM